MKAKLMAVTIAGALTLGTLAVYAHEPGDHGRMFKHCGFGRGNVVEHLTRELDLTPEQQVQLAPIVEQAKPQIKAIHEEAMQKTRAVMENASAQLRPLLTPEQQTKLDAIKKAHEEMLNAMRNLHEARQQ